MSFCFVLFLMTQYMVYLGMGSMGTESWLVEYLLNVD